MIFLVRNALIVLAMILSPFWLAWVCGGMICDRAGQRRSLSVLKESKCF